MTVGERRSVPAQHRNLFRIAGELFKFEPVFLEHLSRRAVFEFDEFVGEFAPVKRHVVHEPAPDISLKFGEPDAPNNTDIVLPQVTGNSGLFHEEKIPDAALHIAERRREFSAVRVRVVPDDDVSTELAPAFQVGVRPGVGRVGPVLGEVVVDRREVGREVVGQNFDIGRRRLGLALAVDERHDLDMRKALFRLRAEFAQKVDDRRADGAVFLNELLTVGAVAKLPAGVVGAHVEDVGPAAFVLHVPENALFEEFSQARIGKAVLAVEDALAFPVHREVFGMGDLHVGQILLLHPVERRRLAVWRQKIMHGVAPERAHDLIVPRNRDLGGVQSFAHSAHLPLTEKEKRRFETVVRAGASAERTERKIEPAPRFAAFHRKTALRNFNSAAHIEEPETEILLQPGVGGVARTVLSVAEKMDIAVFRENAVLARLERREIESFRRDGVVDAF